MRGVEPKSTSKRKRTLLVITVFLGISLALYFYRGFGLIQFFQGAVQSVFSSPRALLYSLRGDSRQEELLNLLKKNEELTSRMVDYELIKRENEALRSQFQISEDYSQSLMSAKIVGFLGQRTMPNAFVINVGENHNIQKGMNVISNKYLVGKVEEVSLNYSVVYTIINDKFQTLAKLPETNANGIIVGHQDFMIFDRVVITDTLKKDGIVVTKGEVGQNGIGILPDIIIGKIRSVSKNESQPFQSAEVVPIVDFSRLTNVFVIQSL